MKKLIFIILIGLFSASITFGAWTSYWSAIDSLIPRTDNTVDVGSSTNKVRSVYSHNVITDLIQATTFLFTGTASGDVYFNAKKLYLDTTNTSWIVATPDNQIDFYANSTDIMTIKGGNIGIGTASPSAKLEISGSLQTSYIELRTTEINEYRTDANQGIFINYRGYNGGTTQFRDLWIGDGKNNNVMLVDGSTSMVGIGTTSPASLLSLYSSTATSELTITAATATYDSLLTFRGGATPSQKFVMGTDASDSYKFKIGTGDIDANNVLTINRSSGYVGIGTTAPYSQLFLQGPNITQIPIGDIIMARYWNNSGPDTRASAIFHYTTLGSLKELLVFGVSSSAVPNQISQAKMVIESTGNVGIGTATPGAKLNVWDGNLFLSDSDVNHGITAGIITGLTNDAYAVIAPYSVTAGGLFLAGISDADSSPLFLQGTFGSSDPSDYRPAIDLIGNKANGTGVQALADAETLLRIDNNATIRVTVLGNGNVGIGTATPSTKLHINGAISIIETSLPNTPDANTAVLYLDSASGGLHIRWDSGATSEIKAHP